MTSVVFSKITIQAQIRLFVFTLIFCAISVFGVALHSPAHAGQKEERAVQFITNLSLRAIASLTDKSLAQEQRDQAFRSLLREALEMDNISRRVLGVYARRATPEIMAELKPVLEETFVLTYANRFEDYDGQQIEVNGTTKGKRKTLIVGTVVTQKETDVDIPVDWHLMIKDDQFRIVDIVINHTFSMVETHRDQYVPIISGAGGDIGTLIAALEKHNAKVRDKRR